jgi:hypothetical protein
MPSDPFSKHPFLRSGAVFLLAFVADQEEGDLSILPISVAENAGAASMNSPTGGNVRRWRTPVKTFLLGMGRGEILAKMIRDLIRRICHP